VYVSDSEWSVNRIMQQNPKIRFYTTSEMVDKRA